MADGEATFPVVGLGASAGGLEALIALLAAVPAHGGLAFIVVVHQHPGHVTYLPELLARRTPLEVVTAAEGVAVAPDRVLVAPPGARVALHGGLIQLLPYDPDGAELPIDAFFRSLAADAGARAVAVILSGTGSDGTVGARSIKAEAGLVIAQQPATAEHDGMPGSVIRAGCADHVLAPAAIAAHLVAHAALLARGGDPATSRLPPDVFQRILLLLRDRTGRDVGQYKPTTIVRRIERRMHVHQVADAAGYLELLGQRPAEVAQLSRDLLISVTTFFRDPQVWAELQELALTPLLRDGPRDRPLRVWVPGCATGEEAYTIAIAIAEVAARLEVVRPVQVFATDLAGDAIETARTGRFPAGIAADVGAVRLARWFVAEDGGFRIRREIREQVAFAPHDLLADPPFTRLDLLSCRNVLIYLQPAPQQRLMPLFHYALNPGGVLLLGSSETVGPTSELFEPIALATRIFRRRPGVAPVRGFGGLRAPAATRPEPAVGAAPAAALAAAVEASLVARYVPPSVVVDERGDVAYVHGPTGAYLELAPGRPVANAFIMARPGLGLALTAAVREAAAGAGRVSRRGVEVGVGAGVDHVVDIVAEPLVAPELAAGLVLVSFERSPAPVAVDGDGADGGDGADDAGHATAADVHLRDLEQQVQRSGDHLHRSIMELQGSNEALQSANEELQSANEELETSKEEMESLNEELQTVNAELQTKVVALSQIHDDMANLLDATDIATVFLDRQLRIKRFSRPVTALVNLRDTDVGRPLADLQTGLAYDRLVDDAAAVLRTLAVREVAVQARSGRSYLMRILPYRTVDNVIDGVVITFTDTTELTAARVAGEARALAGNIVATVREPLLVLDRDLRILVANAAFHRCFRVTEEEILGQPLAAVVGGAWDLPELRRRLTEVLRHDGVVEGFAVERELPGLGVRRMVLDARRLRQASDQPDLVLLAMEVVASPDR